MTSYSTTIHGPGWVADQMIFVMGDESVEPVPVTQDELRPTQDGFFVHPQGDSWLNSDRLLTEPGLLVLVGEPGTGRGTAALRRLREQCRSDRLIRLEAHWEQPKATLLPPAEPGHGYLLDVSEYSKSPSADFGLQLLSWARNAQARLAVLTSETKAKESWLRPLHQHIVRASTPAGRALAVSMLQNTSVDLVGRLDDEAFSAIWKSSPRASEVFRLVGILRDASPDTTNKDIAEEFLGWQNWFTEKCPSDLGSRALVWSAAMCDGGRRGSVLTMSEKLRTRLGQRRTAVDVFSDDFASQRLAKALIVERDGGAYLDPQSHGLAAAVRLHLWEQFETYQDTLLAWSIDCALDIESDDAHRVVASVMDLAVRCEGHALVQRLFDGLAGQRPELLVKALSRAALDPILGSYVRGRLYTWLAAKPSQEKIDIVSERMFCYG